MNRRVTIWIACDKGLDYAGFMLALRLEELLVNRHFGIEVDLSGARISTLEIS